MTVKVAPPLDIKSSFNSSIPEPDAGRGEEVWQEESQRIVEINTALAGSMPIDSVYVAGSGLYCLVGNESIGYTIERFDESGASIGSIEVPSLSSPPSIISFNTSLSFDSVNNNLMIGVATWLKGGGPLEKPEAWYFEFLSFDVNLTSYSSVYLPTSFGYNEHGKSSEFKFKTDGANVIFLAINKADSLEPETGRELAAFRLDGMIPIGKMSVGFTDFFASEGDFYLTNGRPALSGGHLTGVVSVFSDELKQVRRISFKLPDSSLGEFSVSAAKSIVTVSTKPTSNELRSQILDKNMINIGVYKRNDEVIKLVTHKKYRCAVDATFDDPELGVNLSPPTWAEIGATNRWAIMDSSTSQRSIFNGGGNVSCSVTSPVDVVGIFGMINVNSVTLTIKQGATTLYTETKSAIDPLFSDTNIKDMVFFTPPFENVQVIVNFTGSSCQAGRFAVGRTSDIGRAVTGTELGDIDYSTIEYDNFGRTVYRERPIVPHHNLQIDVAKSKSISISRKIQSLRGLDVMWIADIGLDEPLIAIGRCERSPITYTNPSLVSYSLKIRGTA